MKAKGKGQKEKGRPQTTFKLKGWLPLTFAFYLFTFSFLLFGEVNVQSKT
jgi:hypothetical protein